MDFWRINFIFYMPSQKKWSGVRSWKRAGHRRGPIPPDPLFSKYARERVSSKLSNWNHILRYTSRGIWSTYSISSKNFVVFKLPSIKTGPNISFRWISAYTLTANLYWWLASRLRCNFFSLQYLKFYELWTNSTLRVRAK